MYTIEYYKRSFIVKINNLGNDAYNIIKELIITGELAADESLEERKLIGFTNSSRTPIREALSRLNFEKFVIRKERKGYIVSPINIDMINSIFQTRLYFEPQVLEAFRESFEHEERLKEFKENFEYYMNEYRVGAFNQEKRKNMNKIDANFHSYLLDATNNVFIIDTLNLVAEHYRRLRICIKKRKSCVRVDDSIQEHIDIIDCLLNKDIDRAKEILRNHLMNSKQDFISSIGGI